AEVSLDALQYVVRRLGPTPTLVVGSYRSTEVDRRHPLARMLAEWSDDPRVAVIPLGAFSADDVGALLATCVADSVFAPGLAEHLHSATDGNPFFAKELIQSLLDTGGLAKAESGWTLSGAGLSGELPATIQQAVESRVARFPEELQETLSVASVLGRSFELKA